MKRIISVFLIFCLVFLAACGHNEPSESEIVQEPIATPQIPLDDTEPEERPLRTITIEGTLPSGVAYADLERLVNKFFYENEHLMAAFSVAVFVDDYVILDNCYGFIGGTAPDFEIRNTPDVVFDWAGMTTALVWVSAMQLFERGLLDLDADIRNYLPDGLIASLREDSEPVTMLHLMNHTSGLSRDLTVSHDPETFWADETADRFYIGDFLASLELSQTWFTTGEVFSISYYPMALAGYIVEQISGMPFYEYVRDNIFAPLGMTHTAIGPGFLDNPVVREQWMQQTTQFSLEHSEIRAFEQGENTREFTRAQRHMFSIYPMGAGVGTMSDLLRFAQALMPDEHGESPLFEHGETLSKMFTVTHDNPRLYHGFMGYDWFGLSNPAALPLIGIWGSSQTGTSNLLLDIESGIGLVFMTNLHSETLFFNEMISLVFGE